MVATTTERKKNTVKIQSLMHQETQPLYIADETVFAWCHGQLPAGARRTTGFAPPPYRAPAFPDRIKMPRHALRSIGPLKGTLFSQFIDECIHPVRITHSIKIS